MNVMQMNLERERKHNVKIHSHWPHFEFNYTKLNQLTRLNKTDDPSIYRIRRARVEQTSHLFRLYPFRLLHFGNFL